MTSIKLKGSDGNLVTQLAHILWKIHHQIPGEGTRLTSRFTRNGHKSRFPTPAIHPSRTWSHLQTRMRPRCKCRKVILKSHTEGLDLKCQFSPLGRGSYLKGMFTTGNGGGYDCASLLTRIFCFSFCILTAIKSSAVIARVAAMMNNLV